MQTVLILKEVIFFEATSLCCDALTGYKKLFSNMNYSSFLV